MKDFCIPRIENKGTLSLRICQVKLESPKDIQTFTLIKKNKSKHL